MNKTRQRHHVYRLNHWKLVYIGDRTGACGNLHRRPGYPDGIEIQTSLITSWEQEGDDILLHTLNSTYRCPLSEYIISSGSLPLLSAIDGAEDISVKRIEESAMIISDQVQ